MKPISKQDAKDLALKFQKIMIKRGYPIKRSSTLEIIAEILGYKDWQDLIACNQSDSDKERERRREAVCSHYDPVITTDRLRQFFGVDELEPGMRSTLWPGYIGPFVRKHEHVEVGDDAVPFRELMTGSFGLVPHWSKDEYIARRTYNARSETVAEKPSFRDAWKQARHCVIPAEAIFEPDWRSGKAIATRINRTDGKPMGIAGLWSSWKNPGSGVVLHSFTMLTVNADDHAFMRNYHKPGDEKRMVVILQDDDYDDWLSAAPEDSRQFLRQFPADMMQVCSSAG